jgi:hypothetical protein
MTLESSFNFVNGMKIDLGIHTNTHCQTGLIFKLIVSRQKHLTKLKKKGLSNIKETGGSWWA